MTLPPFSAVLLVCGSRRLVQIDGARAKVLAILRKWIESHPDDARIVTGDATGPDTWTYWEHALWYGARYRWRTGNWHATRLVSRFTLNGTARHEVNNAPSLELVERWVSVDDWRAWSRDRRLLARNAAVVRWAASQGVRCHAIVFEAPNDHRHGTTHTLGLCRLSRFASVERVVIE